MSQEERLREKLVKIREILKEDIGFEVYPFKVQWYNELVDKTYQLPYDMNTIAVVVISTPDMFDKAFKQYLATGLYKFTENPSYEALIYYLEQVQKILPETDVRYYFEMNGKNEATILTQTAAHIAGGAFYYQRKDVQDAPWDKDKKIYGFSFHPRYGGWVSLDAVIFLKDLKYPDLQKCEPVDCIPTNKERIRLLKLLNEDHDYWGMRDIISVEKRYSEEQIKYLKASISERKAMVKKMIENMNKQN